MDQYALQQLNRPTNLRAEFYFDEHHEKELCKVWVVGDTGNVLKEITPELIEQFPREYEHYRKTKGDAPEVVDGTPLREIPGVTREVAAVLRYNVIRTAEEFAALDEEQAAKLGMNYREFYRAAKYLIAAKEKKAQEQEIIELRALLEEKKKRGPGRPRKDETDQPSLDDATDAA